MTDEELVAIEAALDACMEPHPDDTAALLAEVRRLRVRLAVTSIYRFGPGESSEIITVGDDGGAVELKLIGPQKFLDELREPLDDALAQHFFRKAEHS